MNADPLTSILNLPLVGILRGASGQTLTHLIPAVIRGGLRNLEITMNTEGAADQIRRTVELAAGQLNVGAGTVMTPHLLEEALRAGARFIVTPIVNREVIAQCVQRNVPVFPGAFSPTEILTAWELGATMVKIFPGETGGPAYLKALLGPFPKIKLMPTGGVDLETAPAFLQAGASALGVGSPLFDKARLDAEDWPWIQAQTERFVALFENAAQQRLVVDGR